FDGLRQASAFLQTEGVEWYEADKTYIESLKNWIRTAESVLSSSGRITHVEDWIRASAFEITVINVQSYGQNMKDMLDSLRNAIEQYEYFIVTGLIAIVKVK